MKIETIKVIGNITAKTRTLFFPNLKEERTISNEEFEELVDFVLDCLDKDEKPNENQQRILDIDEDIYFYVPDNVFETYSDEELVEYINKEIGE